MMQVYWKRFKAWCRNGCLYYLAWYLWLRLVKMIKQWSPLLYMILDHLCPLLLFMIYLYQQISMCRSMCFLMVHQLLHCHQSSLLHMVLSQVMVTPLQVHIYPYYSRRVKWNLQFLALKIFILLLCILLQLQALPLWPSHHCLLMLLVSHHFFSPYRKSSMSLNSKLSWI